MTQKVRALGLVVVALAAIGGASAQGASAAEFVTSEGGVHLPGTISWTTRTGSVDTVATGGQNVECHGSYQSVSNGTGTEVEMPPEYTHPETELSYCTTEASSSKTLSNTNGCALIAHAGSLVGEGEYVGTVDIACPEGEEIEFEIKGLLEQTTCRILIGSQSGLEQVTYRNTEASERQVVEADVAAENLAYTAEGGLFGCGVANGEYSDGAYKAEVTGEAFSEEEEPIDLELSGE